jgi:hypothetical protein
MTVTARPTTFTSQPGAILRLRQLDLGQKVPRTANTPGPRKTVRARDQPIPLLATRSSAQTNASRRDPLGHCLERRPTGLSPRVDWCRLQGPKALRWDHIRHFWERRPTGLPPKVSWCCPQSPKAPPLTRQHRETPPPSTAPETLRPPGRPAAGRTPATARRTTRIGRTQPRWNGSGGGEESCGAKHSKANGRANTRSTGVLGTRKNPPDAEVSSRGPRRIPERTLQQRSR